MFFTLEFPEPGIVPATQHLIKEAFISAMTPLEGYGATSLGCIPLALVSLINATAFASLLASQHTIIPQGTRSLGLIIASLILHRIKLRLEATGRGPPRITPPPQGQEPS